ncbi:NfeD family protein [Bowmanella sp. Y26]|uniref:NfeD family protein n=1 Tax=Bowmanella yangjiangensis TaxID=2811230 RepID=UPI001BDD6310|nr:NfeD family protein [Bowmanella yangjiangensis]MBT1066043.1 NfeD family protein [Bowmanella yangjiangensis]
MTVFTEHMAESLMVLGLALLAIEVLVLGFATFVLFFVGLAALATGLMMYMGILSQDMFSALASVAIFSALLALILWKPLKNLQSKGKPKQVQSDLIGYQFELPEALQPGKSMEYRYSGITWQVHSQQPIEAGQTVQVVKVAVGRLDVTPVQDPS